MTPSNDRKSIATFAIIAILILGMAVVNFTNLATARASQRAREVALRKVLGANRRQLIIQFVGESILISAVSMILALALVELLVKPFAAFLDSDLSLSYFGKEGILLPAVLLTFLVGMTSGLYPAFFLSRFQPAQVLKANRSAAETPGSGRLRTALVVLQFAVSIGLIVCTAVIYGPDSLRPFGRSGVQAGPHPAGRRDGAGPALSNGGNDRQSDQARPGGRRGRSHRHWRRDQQ
jgi:putative ABC transport system permease protein